MERLRGIIAPPVKQPAHATTTTTHRRSGQRVFAPLGSAARCRPTDLRCEIHCRGLDVGLLAGTVVASRIVESDRLGCGPAELVGGQIDDVGPALLIAELAPVVATASITLPLSKGSMSLPSKYANNYALSANYSR